MSVEEAIRRVGRIERELMDTLAHFPQRPSGTPADGFTYVSRAADLLAQAAVALKEVQS